jgi:diguanylate cyclase (GGDEF)-like protein
MAFVKNIDLFGTPAAEESNVAGASLPDLEQRIDALLRVRISQTRMPPDIKRLFIHRIRSNTRKTSTAWCFWVAGLIMLNAGFDYFTAPHSLFLTLVGFRLIISGSLIGSGVLLNRDILPALNPLYLGVPCVLAVILAGVGGLISGDASQLTRYLNEAAVAPESAIMFIGLDMVFNFSVAAVCLPLITGFLLASHLQPFAARLQLPFFDACTMFALIYARHVQNLILRRLFLVNMRDELRNSKARLRQAQLSSLAYTDKLTDIPNRLYFEEICAAMSETTGNLLPLSLCMIDIDHFKKLNDSLGHLQGDRCLKLVAATIRNNLRNRSDIVARFGGEEFVVLLPGANMAGAWDSAERIRLAVMNLAHTNPGSPSGVVTVSIGVAEIPAPPLNVTLLLQHADQALYRAKLSGRNRISN